jgi:hypothetical protein
MNDTRHNDPDRPRPADDHAVTRQCGRCRAHFAVPAGTHPFELRDWWACAACSGALLPSREGGGA